MLSWKTSTLSPQRLGLFSQLFTAETFFWSLYGSDFRTVIVVHFIIKMAVLTDFYLSLSVLQGALDKPPKENHKLDLNWQYFFLNLL